MAIFNKDDKVFADWARRPGDARWSPKRRMGLLARWGVHHAVNVKPAWATLKDCRFAGIYCSVDTRRYFALSSRFNPERYGADKCLAADRKPLVAPASRRNLVSDVRAWQWRRKDV